MPIYRLPLDKITVINESKTRGISIEFPKDMKNGELLDRINEFRDELLKAIEDEKKEQKAETVPHSTQTEIIKPEVIEEKKEIKSQKK